MDSINKNKRYNTMSNMSDEESPIKLKNPVNIKNFSNFKISDMSNDINKNSNDYEFKFTRKLIRKKIFLNLLKLDNIIQSKTKWKQLPLLRLIIENGAHF